MEKKVEDERKLFKIPGVRYLFAANGFLGFCVVYALRVNINVAIVAMVNNTAVYHTDNASSSEECKAPSAIGTNSSEYHPAQDGEFIWSPKMQGVVLGAFYYGYVISQIPGGRMAEIFSAKWVFGIGNLITALLTLLTPVAARCHVGLLITVRALEGLAQGVTIPAMNSMLGRWLPDSEKGVLNTFVLIGINVGTVVSMPLAGFLCNSQVFGGWPSVFYVIGTFGCIWFFVWCLLVTDSPASHPLITKHELEYITSNQKIVLNEVLPPIPWMKIAKSVPFWAFLITRVCQDWSFYIFTNDLPTFFHTILHLDIQKNSILSSIPHLLQSILGLFVAFLADVTVRRNLASTNFVRKFCNSVAGFGSALGLIGVCFAGCDVTMNVVFFMYLMSITGFAFSGQGLTLLDISPEYAGTLMGITNTISNLNGFLTPLFVGALTNEHQTSYQWQIVFGTTATVLIFATVVFAVFSTSEKQDWANTTETLCVKNETSIGNKPNKYYEIINES